MGESGNILKMAQSKICGVRSSLLDGHRRYLPGTMNRSTSGCNFFRLSNRNRDNKKVEDTLGNGEGPGNRESLGTRKPAIKNTEFGELEFTNPPDTDRPKSTFKGSLTPQKIYNVQSTKPLASVAGLKDRWDNF
jgi:hypothetical protein